MNHLKNYIRIYLGQRRKTRRITRTATLLTGILVFLTVYTLILPALSLEKDTYCGIEEHEHSRDCYEQILTCDQEEHIHTEDCYDEEGNAICGKEEHTHDDNCYEELLTCGKERHVHSKACYQRPEEAAPEEAAFDLSDFFAGSTGIWYQSVSKEQEVTWKRVGKKTVLDSDSPIRIHLSFKLPQGELDSVSDVVVYTLPENIALTQETADWLNDDQNGVNQLILGTSTPDKASGKEEYLAGKYQLMQDEDEKWQMEITWDPYALSENTGRSVDVWADMYVSGSELLPETDGSYDIVFAEKTEEHGKTAVSFAGVKEAEKVSASADAQNDPAQEAAVSTAEKELSGENIPSEEDVPDASETAGTTETKKNAGILKSSKSAKAPKAAEARQGDPVSIEPWIDTVNITAANGQTVDKDGNVYIVKDSQSYDIELKFSVDNFSDISYTGEDGKQYLPPLIYPVPEGVDLDFDLSRTFDVKVGRYTISGNSLTTVTGADGKKYLQIDFNSNNRYYSQLVNANNPWFDIEMTGTFTGETEEIRFGGSSDKGVVPIRMDDSHNVGVEKVGSYTYDEKTKTGKIDYTVKVTGTSGTSANINLLDTMEGKALTFNSGSVWMQKNNPYAAMTEGKDYSILSQTADGVSLTINEVKEGQVVEVHYSASVNLDNLTSSTNLTYDETGNRVTINAPGDDDTSDNEDTYVERNVPFSSLSKVSTGTSDVEEIGGRKYRIVTWKVTANSEKIVSLKDSSIKDTNLSKDIMSYYGDGIMVSVDGAEGELHKWSEVDPQSSGNWEFKITDDGKPHSYEITYQTKVDVTDLGENQTREVNNYAQSKYDNDTEKVPVTPPAKDTSKDPSISKYSTNVNEETVTWKIALSIPKDYEGNQEFSIDDLLPYLSSTGYYDSIESVKVDGLTSNESWKQENIIQAIWDKSLQQNVDTVTGVSIIFQHKENGSVVNGLEKNSQANRTVTIEVVTKNNQDWLKYSEQYAWSASHTNKAVLKEGGEPIGKPTEGNAQPSRQIITKAAATKGSYRYFAGDKDDWSNTAYLPVYGFTVTLQGVTHEDFDILETFNTDFFELYTTGDDLGGKFQDYNQISYGSDIWSYTGSDKKVTATPTASGARLHIGELPKTEKGELYGYYRITYYLKVKDADALKQLQEYVIKNGRVTGKNGNRTARTYTFDNIATWDGSPGTAQFEYSVDKIIEKTGSYDEGKDVYNYTITINPDELTINGGDHFDMTDLFQGVEVSKDLDISDIHITEWDQEGNEYDDDFIEVDSESLIPDNDYIESHQGHELGEDSAYKDHITHDHKIDKETVFLYINPTTHIVTAEIPDATKIVITYTAKPTHDMTIDTETGKAKETVTNTANALDYSYTVNFEKEYEFLKKTKSASENGLVPFTIDFNEKKLKLNGGQNITLKDKVSGSIIINDGEGDTENSFKVTADPDTGSAVAAAVKASMGKTTEKVDGKTLTVYTFTVPDQTHITIEYTGNAQYELQESNASEKEDNPGVLKSRFSNTVTALEVSKTVDGGDETAIIDKTHYGMITDTDSPYNGEIPFEIVFNPLGEELNGGEDIVLTDDFENLIINYASIRITADPEPETPVSYDFSGTTGTFHVPDSTAITITYSAKPDYSKAVGDTVTWKNTAEAKDYRKTESSSSTEDGSISGGGDQNREMYLLKYQTGHMENPLPSVRFNLFKLGGLDQDGSIIYEPMVYGTGATRGTAGEQISYTTETDVSDNNPYGAGYVLVSLDNSYGKGYRFAEDQIYFLQEAEAPEGYAYDDTMYVFVFPGDHFEWPSYYTGYKLTMGIGEILKVKNDKLVDSVTVSKSWVNADGSTRWPDGMEVDVQLWLQKKNSTGEVEQEEAVTAAPKYYQDILGDDSSTPEEKAAAQAAVDAWKNGTVTLDKSTPKTTWEHLNKLEDGENYAVKEIAVRKNGTALSSEEKAKYTTTVSNVNNGVATIKNVEKTSVEVEKLWSVGEDTSWPEDVASVTIGLYQQIADGKATAVKKGHDDYTVTIRKTDPEKKAVFTDLAQFDDDGSKISYSIKELSVKKTDGTTATAGSNGKIDGYTVINGAVSGGKATVTNRKASPMQIVVKKTFADWPEGLDSEKQKALKNALTFTITGPNDFSESSVLANTDNFIYDEAGKTYTWTLKVEEEGKYTVKEENADVAGCSRTTTIKLNGGTISNKNDSVSLTAEAGENLVEFKNAYKEHDDSEISVTVNKVWKDSSGKEITTALPDNANVKVALMRQVLSGNTGSGTTEKEVRLLVDSNDRNRSKDIVIGTAEVGSIVTVTIEKQSIDHGNNWIEEYWPDLSIKHTEPNNGIGTLGGVSTSTNGNIKTYTFTMPERDDLFIYVNSNNSYESYVTDKLSHNLKASATKLNTAVLNNANGWTCTFDGLDKTDEDGNPYTYYVVEESSSLPGYTVSYEQEGGSPKKITGGDGSITVTNTATTTTNTDFKVKKSWINQNNDPVDLTDTERYITFELFGVRTGGGSGETTVKADGLTVNAGVGDTIEAVYTCTFNDPAQAQKFIDRISNDKQNIRIITKYLYKNQGEPNTNNTGNTYVADLTPVVSEDGKTVTVTAAFNVGEGLFAADHPNVTITDVELEKSLDGSPVLTSLSNKSSSVEIDWSKYTNQEEVEKLAADTGAVPVSFGIWTLRYSDTVGTDHWAKLFTNLPAGCTYYAVERSVDGDTSLTADNYNPQYGYSADNGAVTITNTLPPSTDYIVQKRFMYNSNDRWYQNYGTEDDDIGSIRFVLLKEVEEGTEGAIKLIKSKTQEAGQDPVVHYGWYTKVITEDADSNGTYILTPAMTVDIKLKEEDTSAGVTLGEGATEQNPVQVRLNWAYKFTNLPGNWNEYRAEECSTDGKTIFDSQDDTSRYMTCTEFGGHVAEGEVAVMALKNDLINVKGFKYWEEPEDGNTYYHPAVTFRLYRKSVTAGQVSAQESADIPRTADDAAADGYADVTALYGTKTLPAGSQPTITYDDNGNETSRINPYVEWAKLPKMDLRTGDYYRYLVLEDSSAPGYTLTNVQKEGTWNEANTVITNKLDMTDLYVKKQWQDEKGNQMTEDLDDMPELSFKVMRVSYVDEARTQMKAGTAAVDVTPEGEDTLPVVTTEHGETKKNWTRVIRDLPKASVNPDGSIIYYSYYVEESTPEGYLVSYQADGKDPTYDPANAVVSMSSTGTTMINRKTDIEINILKVDFESRSPISGAKFILQRYTDASFREVQKTYEEAEVDENGRLKIPGLSTGYYKLVESKMPDGYNKLSADPRFEVYLKTDGQTPEIKIRMLNTSEEVFYELKDGSHTFTVGNHSGAELPMTGGVGTTSFTLIGGMLFVLAGIILLIKRRKYMLM